jgi:hypothetical protein
MRGRARQGQRRMHSAAPQEIQSRRERWVSECLKGTRRRSRWVWRSEHFCRICVLCRTACGWRRCAALWGVPARQASSGTQVFRAGLCYGRHVPARERWSHQSSGHATSGPRAGIHGGITPHARPHSLCIGVCRSAAQVTLASRCPHSGSGGAPKHGGQRRDCRREGGRPAGRLLGWAVPPRRARSTPDPGRRNGAAPG